MVTKKQLEGRHQAGLDFFREHVEVVDVSDEPKPSKCPNCPHPMKGLHHYKTGKCKLCPCEGPKGDVKGGYASTLSASTSSGGVPEKHRKRIAKQNAQMPTPMADVLNTDFGAALSRDFKRLTKGKKR